MLLEWKKTFAIGHWALDAEHKRLVDIINCVHDAEAAGGPPSNVHDLLKALHLATVEHFRHENSVIRDMVASYPQVGHGMLGESTVNEHCAEHAHSLIELENMLHLIAADRKKGLANELRDWFVDHATKHDSQLKTLFSRDPSSGSEATTGSE